MEVLNGIIERVGNIDDKADTNIKENEIFNEK